MRKILYTFILFMPMSLCWAGDLVVYAGQLDFDKTSPKNKYKSIEFGTEFRGNIFSDYLVPLGGAHITEKKAMFFYLGLGLETKQFNHLSFGINFTPGLYRKGGGKDLGYKLEFKSQAEIWYHWQKIKFGVAVNHISNAGLGSKNPGSNALIASLAVNLW